MPIIEMVNLLRADTSNTGDERIIDSPGRSAAKRCLFDRPDHDDTIQRLTKELQDQRAEDLQRWNFDFQSERPLSGRYEWSPVNVRTVGFLSKRPRMDSCSSTDTKDLPQLISRKDGGPVQTKITDFMRTRKISVSSIASKASEDSEIFDSSLEDDLETASH